MCQFNSGCPGHFDQDSQGFFPCTVQTGCASGAIKEKTYLVNAFSLSMLPEQDCTVLVRNADNAALICIFRCNAVINAVGHQDTAALADNFLNNLGVAPPPYTPGQRPSVSLNVGDSLIVCQYVGPRLPEGATQLPEGARLVWKRVFVQ